MKPFLFKDPQTGIEFEVSTIGAKKLHELALNYGAITYDPRMAAAMTPRQFTNYTTNTGHTYYLYLFNLISLLRPRTVLELGTSIGRSGLFMMCALPQDSTFTTIDIGSHMRAELKPFYDDRRLRIVYGDDTLESTYLPLKLKDVDFLFIDSLHEYDHLVKEWEIYRHFLEDGAIVVMDDIHLNPGMQRFWDELPYSKIDTGDGLHFSGFGLFNYKT